MATNNNFTVIGFVAVDANALQNIEVATKADSPKLDLLKKGSLIKVTGFFEPQSYVGKDEKEHFTLVWKATAIEKVEKKEDTQEA